MPAARLFVYTHIASIGGLPLAGGCPCTTLRGGLQLSFFPSVCDLYDFLYYIPVAKLEEHAYRHIPPLRRTSSECS